MKRYVGFWIVAAILLAIPLSHVANAQKEEPPAPMDEEDTVLICHVSGNDGTGKVIAVNDNAIPGHRNHGDCFVKCAVPGDDCRCKVKPGPK